MNKCDISWCKVFYAKSGIVTAYCAKTKQQIQNVSKHAETASWVELTQQMFVLSHQAVKGVVQNWYEVAGIDFSDVFSHMDFLRKCSRKWQKVCMGLYTYEQQVGIVEDDHNVEIALKIFSLKACS